METCIICKKHFKKPATHYAQHVARGEMEFVDVPVLAVKRVYCKPGEKIGAFLSTRSKPFVLVLHTDPFFAEVYAMLRKHNTEKGIWTTEDEIVYQAEILGVAITQARAESKPSELSAEDYLTEAFGVDTLDEIMGGGE